MAACAGVELHRDYGEWAKEGVEWQSQKTMLLDISELAVKFFEKQLYQSETGKQVLAYLHDRGLTADSIKSFRLGYAPDSWNTLGDFLKRSHNSKEIFDAGLIVKKDNREYYDRFRPRIIFPIADINGQIIGLSHFYKVF